MATASARGTSVVSTVLTTWASTANAFDGAVGTNPATYATWVNAARSTVGQITIGGYTFTGPGSGYTINSVTAVIRHLESSTTLITGVTVQLQTSTGTNIGSAVAVPARSTTAISHTLTLGTPTAAQVVAGLRVLVSITRSNSTTSTTFSLDQVDLTVDYTAPALAETVTEGFLTKDTTKWTWKGTADVANGYGSIPCTATYDGIVTNAVLTLVGSYWSAQVIKRHSGTGGSEDLIGMLLSNADINNYEAWLIQGTSLIARERVANVDSQTSTTFDPAAHQYLRVRESGGTVFWDYSADGITWTNFRSKAAGLTLTAMYGAVLSGIFGTDATPGTLRVDNVNSFTPKFATFVEDFSTSTRWTMRGATTTITGGQLVIQPTTNTGAFDAYTNNAQGHLDLQDSSVMFNIAQMIPSTDHCLLYLLNSAQTDALHFYKYTDGNLYACQRVGGVDTNINPVPWDSVNHKYLRIRESGGIAYWETSPTGLGSWTVQRSEAWAVASINSLFIDILGASDNATSGAASPLIVEDVNVIPTPAVSLAPPVRRPNYGSLLQL